jgi:hypothetical protein
VGKRIKAKEIAVSTPEPETEDETLEEKSKKQNNYVWDEWGNQGWVYILDGKYWLTKVDLPSGTITPVSMTKEEWDQRNNNLKQARSVK